MLKVEIDLCALSLYGSNVQQTNVCEIVSGQFVTLESQNRILQLSGKYDVANLG